MQDREGKWARSLWIEYTEARKEDGMLCLSSCTIARVIFADLPRHCRCVCKSLQGLEYGLLSSMDTEVASFVYATGPFQALVENITGLRK